MRSRFKILIFRVESNVLSLLSQAMERKGLEVVYCNPLSFETFEKLAETIQKISPSFCLAQNHYSFDPLHPVLGKLESFLKAEKIPTVVWYVDDPRMSGSYASILTMSEQQNTQTFFYFYSDPSHSSFFSKRNLYAELLRSAADGELRNFSASATQQDLSLVARPCFIDAQPMRQLDDIRWTAINHYFETLCHTLRIPADKRDEWASQLEEPLNQFFGLPPRDREAYLKSRDQLVASTSNLWPSEANKISSFMLGTADHLYSAMELLFYVMRLRQRHLNLYGGEIWSNLIPGLEQTPRYLSSKDLYEVYGSTRISFCYTKRQFLSGVVERPLHILAAGGFPLTDYREDLESMFEKDEIVSYRTIEEAESLIDFYLRHSTEREQIAARGRERVFKNHTYAHRVDQICHTVSKHFDL